jgi:hypothetical protein
MIFEEYLPKEIAKIINGIDLILEGLANLLHQLGGGYGAFDASDELSFIVKNEGRICVDAVMGSKVLVAIAIDFNNLNFVGHLGTNFFEGFSHNLAGATPGGIKIYKNWLFGLL